MAKSYKGRYGGRKVTGNANTISSKTRRCWVCDKCLYRHYEKPDFYCQAPDCNNTTFLHFDSRTEADRWAQLCMLQRAGEITELRRQTRFGLRASTGKPVGHYVADFDYCDRDGRFVVEDVKGSLITDLSAWKHRHFEAQYGFKITIV